MRSARLVLATVLLTACASAARAEDDARALRQRIAELESRLEQAGKQQELAKAGIATLEAEVAELRRSSVPFAKLRDLDSDDLYRDGVLTETAVDVLGMTPDERRRVAAAFAGAQAGMVALLAEHAVPVVEAGKATVSVPAFDAGTLGPGLLGGVRDALGGDRAGFLLARIGDDIETRHLHFGKSALEVTVRRGGDGYTVEERSDFRSSTWSGLAALPKELALLRPHLPKDLLGDAEPAAAPAASATGPAGTADF